MSSRPRLALEATVKNERHLLRFNLLYHHYLGVEKCFVFDDGSTDDTNDTIRDLPFVQIAPSTAPERFAGQSEYAEFLARAGDFHCARQNLNSLSAMQQSQEEGFDWIISLDADELVCTDLNQAYPGQLVDFFTQIPSAIELVRFSTLELVQRDVDYTNVFAEGTLFKMLELGKYITHWMYNPFRRWLNMHRGFYGQGMGKSAVKTGIKAKPKTPHKYVHLDGSRLNTLWKGYLLHYHCYNFPDFIRKYRNFKTHPDAYISGAMVEPVKRLWRDVVNNPDFSEEYLHQYFRRWIAFGDRAVQRLRRDRQFRFFSRPSPLVEVTAVRQAFSRDLKEQEAESPN